MVDKEQRVANKIADLINDVTLDLDEVGKNLVEQQMTVSYNRLVLLPEAAIEEKERQNERQLNTLF